MLTYSRARIVDPIQVPCKVAGTSIDFKELSDYLEVVSSTKIGTPTTGHKDLGLGQVNDVYVLMTLVRIQPM